jgi:hypothetical protein
MKDPEAVLNFILSDLLNAPTEGDVLAWNGKEFIVDGQRTSPQQTLAIIEAARELADNFAFNIRHEIVNSKGAPKMGANQERLDHAAPTLKGRNGLVPRDGIEPPTRGFSVLCSTN